MGVVQPAANVVQVVLGPIADQVAGEIRAHLRAGRPLQPSMPVTVAMPATAGTAPSSVVLLDALGGRTNLRTATALGSRLLLELIDVHRIDGPGLLALGVRDIGFSSHGSLHLLMAGDAALAATALQSKIS